MIEEPEILILLEENDKGDAGKRIWDSVLILALLWRCGPLPESPELASVTIELAPMLVPEVATLFITLLGMSAKTGGTLGCIFLGTGFDMFPNDPI
ncbi:hypothetical protein HanXRQr2_Chr04g0164931 [Helianthus annuus]|uniref:Uncharacterized protein n=1 Tax=Helianthus annuus TaxID=4232 RepID=A0A9K3J7Z3_HELAN|nr:hypothetical protein HanXRQr2_Chr04g0164931 [Helianthus annuus]KAJ0931200.1 hypothetical protein HanPSC8_Chr04g0158791 [Helianthus annuus]